MGIFSKHRDETAGGGAWHLSSKSDPRWNCSGWASGMWSAMAEMEGVVEARKTWLGDPPPDLENAFFKV